MITHVHHFSVMVVDNGFVIQETFRSADKTVTLVARDVNELIKELTEYLQKRSSEGT